MSKMLKMRLKKLEKRHPTIENEQLPLLEFSLEEQAALKKAEEVGEKLRCFATENDRYGTFQATKEDRQALVAAALLVENHTEKQVLEVTQSN